MHSTFNVHPFIEFVLFTISFIYGLPFGLPIAFANYTFKSCFKITFPNCVPTLRSYIKPMALGQTSFGKGSHQGCAKIKNNEALTICSTGGLFFAPSGESNQTVGIVPHISVYINKEPQDLELYAQREAQMYLFPLQPKKMAKPPKGSWNLLKAPTACLETLNLSSKYEKAVGTVLYFKDYQMLNALGAVVCQ